MQKFSIIFLLVTQSFGIIQTLRDKEHAEQCVTDVYYLTQDFGKLMNTDP